MEDCPMKHKLLKTKPKETDDLNEPITVFLRGKN